MEVTEPRTYIPSSERCSTSALESISILTMSRCPFLAAHVSGVIMPYLLAAFTLHFAAMRRFTTLVCPFAHARMSGEWLRVFFKRVFAFASSNRWQHSKCPNSAACTHTGACDASIMHGDGTNTTHFFYRNVPCARRQNCKQGGTNALELVRCSLFCLRGSHRLSSPGAVRILGCGYLMLQAAMVSFLSNQPCPEASTFQAKAERPKTSSARAAGSPA